MACLRLSKRCWKCVRILELKIKDSKIFEGFVGMCEKKVGNEKIVFESFW